MRVSIDAGADDSVGEDDPTVLGVGFLVLAAGGRTLLAVAHHFHLGGRHTLHGEEALHGADRE